MTRKDPDIPYTLAAPSFVWPERVGENCRRLKGMVDEVALLFFQTRASLEYDQQDLPPDLTDLGLTYHLHLPLDLPWESGPEEVHRLTRALKAKTQYLSPHGYVLHPPEDAGSLQEFLRLWSLRSDPARLFLENIRENDLASHWQLVQRYGCKVCLDLGHLLEHGQERLLELPGLWSHTRMLHAYSPAPGGGHTSLARLDEHGLSILQNALQNMHSDTVVVLEVFDPEDLHESLDIFRSWFRSGKLAPGTGSG